MLCDFFKAIESRSNMIQDIIPHQFQLHYFQVVPTTMHK